VHPLPYRGARLAGLFGAALGLGLLAHAFAARGALGVGIKLAAVLAFVALVARMNVWRERGSVAGPR